MLTQDRPNGSRDEFLMEVYAFSDTELTNILNENTFDSVWRPLNVKLS
jgi:hypothetical protein